MKVEIEVTPGQDLSFANVENLIKDVGWSMSSGDIITRNGILLERSYSTYRVRIAEPYEEEAIKEDFNEECNI